MKPFLHDNFLLPTEPAQRLFHEYAKRQPILDYHSHLNPQSIAENTRFTDIAQLWLGGDHYKWRQMRSNGIPEARITGQTPGLDSFKAWAQTMEKLPGNPLYHWTHLELKRYFGINEVLNEASAERIYHQVNEMLGSPGFAVQDLLAKMNVVAVCTTDDPADDLKFHRAHQATVVLAPTFRPDQALALDKPTYFEYLQKLGHASGLEISSLASLKQALASRHQFFHDMGCRLSDHALVVPPARQLDVASLERAFAARLQGKLPDPLLLEALQTDLLVEIARLNKLAGWTMQLHIGAQRNLNTAQFNRLGPDTGYDAISDLPVGRELAGFLDACQRQDALGRVILYSLNPQANDMLGTIMGCFQDGSVAGKIQLGSAWWFNDHIDGMRLQLQALSNLGLLSRFVGMLTDSRSFLSFPRHEYFRRILCGMVGEWMEEGLVPGDYALMGGMVSNICFANARDFFRLPGLKAQAS